MKRHLLMPLASLGLLASSASAASLLVNGGFEDGTLTGWTNNNGGAITIAIGQPVPLGPQAGSFSAFLTMNTGDGVPEMRQEFPASPGQIYNFSGYMMTPASIPAGTSFGLLKMVYRDAANADLQVIQASIGTIVGPGNPGIETAQVNSTSDINRWYFLEAQGTAPANTAKVLFLALDIEFNPAPNHTVYVDSMQASLVPEPTSFTIAGLGALGLLARRRRR